MNDPRACSAGALIGALLLLGACGAHAINRGVSSLPAARSTSSASAGTACKTGARSVCITSGANGKLVTVGVGWTVTLDLQAPRSLWSEPTEVGARLLRKIGAVRQSGGAVEVRYRAVAPGRTDLRAFERPLCAPRRICPQFILVWEVHLRVGGR